MPFRLNHAVLLRFLGARELGDEEQRPQMHPGSRERVELYFGDGSLMTLSAGSPEAERLLAQARELLAAARG